MAEMVRYYMHFKASSLANLHMRDTWDSECSSR